LFRHRWILAGGKQKEEDNVDRATPSSKGAWDDDTCLIRLHVAGFPVDAGQRQRREEHAEWLAQEEERDQRTEEAASGSSEEEEEVDEARRAARVEEEERALVRVCYARCLATYWVWHHCAARVACT